jgi:hypothetical protein
MTKTLQKAFAEAANLPEAAQEQIGRDLLTHIRKLRKLRADIQKGFRSLDAGKGRELDVEDFLKRARKRYAKR